MLIGNGARQFAHARTKQSGGGIWGAQLLGWNNPGRRNNRVLAWGGEWAGGKSSVPAGRTHPSAWLMPISSGSMAGRVTGTLTMSGAGVEGVAAEGAVVAAFTFSGNGGLISSAVGAITATFSMSGSITAPANAVGAIVATFTMTGALGAMAGVTGAIIGTFSLAASPSAIGHMEGDIGADGAEVTPQSIAQAVWAVLAAEADAAGTMGEKLNGAGSAGNPWTETIESGMNAAQALRLITAAVAGELSGAATNTITIRSAVADDTDRITATVDEDGNRTQISYDLD